MKVTFVGGGSFRTLPIVRAALAEGIFGPKGEVALVDFNLERARTVSGLIRQCPEFKAKPCSVTVTDKLAQALPGSRLVSISFPVCSPEVKMRSEAASLRQGFVGTDQLSLSGAFRSLTGGTAVLGIARQMEKHCPSAWLAIFANPVAVYSGMVNNHTRIKALGICGGLNNFRWDLTRMLLGKEGYAEDYRIAVAGVNHMSYILRGTFKGKDIYKLLGKALANPKWEPCRIPGKPYQELYIRNALRLQAELYRRFGKVIFSTEGDGLMHLFLENALALPSAKSAAMAEKQIKDAAKAQVAGRAKADAEYRELLGKDVDASVWKQSWQENIKFGANPREATVTVLRALSGKPQWLVASYPNRGAIKGFKDRTVVEYSMSFSQRGVQPEPDLEVPDCFHGIASSLATHQTLLGDAIATQNPRTFAEALFAYPLYQNMDSTRQLCRELLKIHAPEAPSAFQKAEHYL